MTKRSDLTSLRKKPRRVLDDKKAINQAIELIRMGARVSILADMLPVSHDRLSLLYREIKGSQPPKGLIPYSEGWYMRWETNIHSSLFYVLYQHVINLEVTDEIERLILSYRMYLDHLGLTEDVDLERDAPPLSLTRAWLLLNLIRIKSFEMRSCQQCQQPFLHYRANELVAISCGFCVIPARSKQTIRRQVELEEEFIANQTHALLSEFASAQH